MMLCRDVFFLLHLLSFMFWSCEFGNFFSSPLALAGRPPCNQTLPSLSSLRETANSLGRQSTDYVICVNLNVSENVDYSPMVFDSISVIITGSSGSIIKCRNEQQLPLSDYTKFPLIFTNSSLVVIEGVHFEGCMRPLKLKWITRVEIISSNFL